MNPELCHAIASAPSDLPAGPRNILVLSPGKEGEHGIAASDEESLASVTQWLTQYGYVYVAREGQKAVEDDAFGVRHLPLRHEALPAFGSLELVVVYDHLVLLQAAQEQYPDTLVVFVESASSVSARAQLAALMLRRAE
jgi:hypothetical protein